MLDEHGNPSGTPARPRRTVARSRAALVSVAGHGALFALLAVLGARSVSPPTESPLIFAELVTALEPAAPPAAEAAAPAAPAEPPGDEPPPAAAPAPAPDTVVAPPPPPPPPAPRPPPRERVVEPAPEPPPLERVVERPAPAPERRAAPPEPLEPLEPPATEAAVAAGPAPPASVAFDSREERAVLRRLSSWTGRFEPGQSSETLAWRDAGQQYTAVLTRIAAADATGMEQLRVELATERDGRRLVTELRMNRIAFSSFAQFVDRWDPDVQIHDDFFDGRFHSNTEIRVSRDRGVQPVFNGKVTLAAGDIRTDGVGHLNRRAMFPAGLETRVRRIVLPPRAAAFDDGAVPADRVRRVEEDSLLTFHADGSLEATPLGGESGERIALGEEPYYFVAGDDVAVHVRGTVNGKVLVYSPKRIVIVDDLLYAADPRLPGTDDYLGLVAERTVEIGGPDLTGPGDLEVHASIYARNRFEVRDYRSRRSGTLIIRGSVTAGSISATEPRFATRIEFDHRLTTMRAPGFPLSDRYELDSASGEWHVVEPL